MSCYDCVYYTAWIEFKNNVGITHHVCKKNVLPVELTGQKILMTCGNLKPLKQYANKKKSYKQNERNFEDE